MTRVVLHSSVDFEPITILDLGPEIYKYLSRNKEIMLPVYEHPRYRWVGPAEPAPERYHSVRIRAEKIRMMEGKEFLMLLTHDEESALLLRAVFLPGQQHQLNEARREAFARGMLAAIRRFG